MDWPAGTRLRLRAADWRVLRTIPYVDCGALHLSPLGGGRVRTFLLPFERPTGRPAAAIRTVSRRRSIRHVGAIVASSFPYGALRTVPRSVRLLPYQLEPALAILRHGARRVLVADDVGLGKTIEAGLVVREIVRDDRLARVLILCPAALRPQWAEELRGHFRLEAIDAGSGWLRRMSLDLPRQVNPWSLPGTYLSSIDFVKRPEALRPLEDVRWDLLVVDEAHLATIGSDRRAAAGALAERSHRLILLTATPHSGDDGQFRALCALGSTPGAPLMFFARDRTHAALPPSRPRSSILAVRPSEAERHVHRLLRAYAARLWRASERRRDAGAGLVATLLMKRALSSPASLAASARRRRALLRDTTDDPTQLHLPLTDEGEDDETPDRLLRTRGLDDRAAESAALDALVEAAEAAALGERKPQALMRLLRRAAEPTLIFTEYRDTAARLRELLTAGGYSASLLHGGLAADARRDAIASLAAGRSHLVATDAAAEGLNLHHGCRLVVHFELPWTPMRLHQRCGRVHRIGQSRRVHEIALVIRDTAESLVLAPLLARAGQAGALSRSPLLQHLTEPLLAAHVLGGQPLPPVRAVAAPDLTPADLRDEARAEADRLSLVRRLVPAARRRAPPAVEPFVAVSDIRCRHGRLPRGVHFVYSLWVRNRAGMVLAHDVVVLSCAAPLERRPRARGLRVRIETLHRTIEAALRVRIESELARSVERTQRLHVEAVRLAHLRAAHLTQTLPSTAQDMVQAGLFDRRALRAQAVRQRQEAVRRGEDAARAAAHDEEIEGAFELRAVLISRPR